MPELRAGILIGHEDVEKLTSILAVLEQPASADWTLRKAAALARHFDARLSLLVVEPLSEERIAPQIAALGYPRITVRTASRLGRRADAVVMDHIREYEPDLVIKARAGARPLRRFSLTPSAWRLSQECPVPLMLVGPRAWSKSPRLAAAVDVSDPETFEVARAVMQAAGFLTLGCHGFLDVLYTEREQHDSVVRMERAVKLAQLVREYHVGCERLQMFEGAPKKRLPPLVAARQYDVLLLGAVTHRDGLAETLGPLTGELVEATAGDVVLVKPPAEQAGFAPHAGASAGEQFSHQLQQLV